MSPAEWGKCEGCGEKVDAYAPHGPAQCIRVLRAQGEMQWRRVLGLEESVARLESGRTLEHEAGTQFVVHVTLDAVEVRWLGKGETASLLAEDMGGAVAKRMGFDQLDGTTFNSSGENSQRWSKGKK